MGELTSGLPSEAQVTATAFSIGHTSAIVVFLFWFLTVQQWIFPAQLPTIGKWKERLKNILIALVFGVLDAFAFAVTTYFCLHAFRNLGIWPSLMVPEHITMPLWAQIIISLLIADAIAFFTHALMHSKLFWPVHMVHHTDLYVDTFSAFRFHPIESIIYAAILSGSIAILGVTAELVVITRSVVKTFSFFVHSDLRFPIAIERILGWVIVTPGHHQIHHDKTTANNNIGLIFTFWDRILGSFKQPEVLPSYSYGLEGYQKRAPGLITLLFLRFKPKKEKI